MLDWLDKIHFWLIRVYFKSYGQIDDFLNVPFFLHFIKPTVFIVIFL